MTCESNAIKLDFPAQEIFEGLKKYWSIYRRLSFADTDCSHEIVFYYCCRDGKYNKRSPNSSAANETTNIALSRIIIAQVAPPPPPGSHTSRIQVLQCIQTTTGIKVFQDDVMSLRDFIRIHIFLICHVYMHLMPMLLNLCFFNKIGWMTQIFTASVSMLTNK